MDESSGKERADDARQASGALSHADGFALLVLWGQDREHAEEGRPGQPGTDGQQRKHEEELYPR